MIQPKKDSNIDAKQEFTRCENHPNIILLFRRLGRSLTSLPSSLRHKAHPNLTKNDNLKQRGWDRDASHNSHIVIFIVKTKRLECPYGLKENLQLMKGSLVRHPLCHIKRHRTDHLSLHFHATSVILSRAPPTVAPPLVLRQNRKTLARLASR
jgi:hypothetical protein